MGEKIYNATVLIAAIKNISAKSSTLPLIGVHIHSLLSAAIILQTRTLSIKMVSARKIAGTKLLNSYQPNIANISYYHNRSQRLYLGDIIV